ncbi:MULTISPECIES: competence-stimulating peptide ComC [Streptococcus]|jgi:competence-stimulating peptide|uniref:Competence-stimulating peptide ComC n=4 Tax=Streptococcus TaxID=1301 RepID=A0A428FUE9_STROR|nr:MULTISPECIES: competence-stimulating peptide ComC [Streptococcus]EFA25202.1 bacteriocin-type signal sequence [Streptococcus sp. M143]EGR93487.1 competence-stimulating peptide type 1 [Streptococcus mitis bv. 2 str. F0392]MBZ2085798.1 competence-stimulating peptide ComC [Streptococcus oralis]MBZ2089327.1 competence-stimulating peptide ComC [Streptococcus oralis]MCY7065898.1 competence-stimulating peptide ComC [Streptococcus oralis]
MKNTVKLEQFKEVTETELQEIRGGEWRIPELIRNLIFPKRK